MNYNKAVFVLQQAANLRKQTVKFASLSKNIKKKTNNFERLMYKHKIILKDSCASIKTFDL